MERETLLGERFRLARERLAFRGVSVVRRVLL